MHLVRHMLEEEKTMKQKAKKNLRTFATEYKKAQFYLIFQLKLNSFILKTGICKPVTIFLVSHVLNTKKP